MARTPSAAQVLGHVVLVTGKEEFLSARTVASVRDAVAVLVGFIPAGLGVSPLVSLPVGVVVLLLLPLVARSGVAAWWPQQVAGQLAGVQSVLDGLMIDRPRRRIIRSGVQRESA